MGDWIQKYRGYGILTLVYAIILGGVVFLRAPSSDDVPLAIHTPMPAPTATTAPIQVHVSGAVVRPAVYSLSPGGRVQDALQAAGGATGDADMDRINLAAWVSDGQKVYVPRRGETDLPSTQSADSLLAGDGRGMKVNINIASAEELDTLPGIGPAYAERVIRYREEQGPFETIEQIMEVRGIGQVCFDDVKERICVR